MGEPKAFASLSSGLLARKGAAKPAMRPQGFGQSGPASRTSAGTTWASSRPSRPTARRDESHDAFGAEIQPLPLRNPLAALTPIGSPVHDQQAEIADRLADCSDEGEEDDDTAELFEADQEPLVAALSEVQPEVDDDPVDSDGRRSRPLRRPRRSRSPGRSPLRRRAPDRGHPLRCRDRRTRRRSRSASTRIGTSSFGWPARFPAARPSRS